MAPIRMPEEEQQVAGAKQSSSPSQSTKFSKSAELSNASPERITADRLFHRSQERRYFDSGDYALSKATSLDSNSSSLMVGTLHPSPEVIPHGRSTGSIGRSPMKEHVFSSDSSLFFPPCDVDESYEEAQMVEHRKFKNQTVASGNGGGGLTK